MKLQFEKSLLSKVFLVKAQPAIDLSQRRYQTDDFISGNQANIEEQEK